MKKRDKIMVVSQTPDDIHYKLFTCPSCGGLFSYRGDISQEFKCIRCEQKLKFSIEKKT